MALGASSGHFFRRHAEDDDVLSADMFEHFHIRAIERADGQRTVQRKFHVAGAGGFHAGRRNLFRKIGGGNHDFGK
ncbi:hypothetical protein D3C78_743100 [compost metagenome]